MPNTIKPWLEDVAGRLDWSRGTLRRGQVKGPPQSVPRRRHMSYSGWQSWEEGGAWEAHS